MVRIIKNRRFVTVLLVALMLTLRASAQNADLKTLLYAKQFAQLEAALASRKVSRRDKMCFQAFLWNAYNKPAASEALLARVFKHEYWINDDTRC